MMTSENTLLILLNCLCLKFRGSSLARFVHKCGSYSLTLTLTLFSNNDIPPTSYFCMQNLLHEFLFYIFYL